MTPKFDASSSHWAPAPGGNLVAAPTGANVFAEDEGLRAQAEQTSVADMMSRGVVCIAADATLDRVTEMLLERDIGSAPVVDAAWRPVGMISKTDLLHALPELLSPPTQNAASPRVRTVGEVSQSVVLSLHEASPISVAAAIMAHEGVHRLPVVNAAGEVVGVVSSLDIVAWVARCTHEGSASDSL